jgi:DNA-binding transcriptional ArsR family regulator
VELLGAGEASVRQIADAMPISRPSVSRHLRLLSDAGLVAAQPLGTRRLYRLHGDGVTAMLAFLTRIWGDAVASGRGAIVSGSKNSTAQKQPNSLGDLGNGG